MIEGSGNTPLRTLQLPQLLIIAKRAYTIVGTISSSSSLNRAYSILFYHLSLSFIAPDKCFKQHIVSSHWCIWVKDFIKEHHLWISPSRSVPSMYLFVLLCDMRSNWPYGNCFVMCCFQDFFLTACSILE